MTRDELRAGLVRLAAAIVLGVASAVVVGVALWWFGGGSLSRAIALTFSLAGALLLLAGAAAGLDAGRLSMDRSAGKRVPRYTSKQERRERELFAVGLMVAGVASFVVSVMVG